jgi:hypothetical protein
LASDQDPCRPDFDPRLLGVPPIRDEHPLRFGEKEGAGAPGESTEIAKVGRMCDQQGVQAMRGERILQTLLTAPMVHPRSLASGRHGGHGDRLRSDSCQQCRRVAIVGAIARLRQQSATPFWAKTNHLLVEPIERAK